MTHGALDYALGGLQTPGFRASLILALAVIAGDSSVAVSTAPCAITFTNPVVTTIPGALGDIVIDDACEHVYITNTTNNRIEDFSLQTMSLQPPIQVGSMPVGLDLHPDGRLLYVANSGGENISVVDLQQRVELRKIAVPPSSVHNDRPFSIAVAPNGVALFSTTFSGSGFGGRIMELNLGTEQTTPRADFTQFNGSVTEATRLRANSDRSIIGIALGNISPAAVFLYDSALNTFSASRTLDGPVSIMTMDTAGSVILATPGSYVLDAALNLSGTIARDPPHAWAGGVVSPNGEIVYRSVMSRIDVLNPRTFLKTGEIAPGASFTNADSYNAIGLMDISPDGRVLAAITNSGLSVMRTGATTFVDDPLRPGQTPLRAVHIAELRSRIDAQRTRLGLSGSAWTDPALTVGVIARAVHVTELRVAVEEAYVQAGRTPPVFSDPAIAGSVIKAAHITELRNATATLEQD